MKRLFLLFPIIFFLLSACETDDYSSPAEPNVVSSTSKIDFEELLILINIKTSAEHYQVVKQIDSVNIYINRQHWAKVSSLPLDTANIKKFKSNQEF